MTENSAIFNARHGAGSFHPHRQLAPTAQDCLKRGNGANWRMTRQLSGECRLKQLNAVKDVRRAAALVNERYERPLHPGASMAARKSYAAEILEHYAGRPSARRESFGHPPHIGHHPATIGRAEKTLAIEDHTGGLVTVVPQ